MRKEQVKKLTLQELIAKKEQIQDTKTNKTKDLYISSLDGSITIQKPDKQLCLDALEMDQQGDTYLVYHCVVQPNVKDKKLLQAFGCTEPIEIVEKLFEIGEISAIAKECITLAGYGDSVTVVEDIKN